jgi:hypothetical protein
MLADISLYEDQTTLIMDSGIQFLDFAATFVTKGQTGEFALIGDAGPLARLVEDERSGKLHFSFDDTKQAVRPTVDLSLDQSLALLLDEWLPVPYFRFSPPARFEQGPSNWARVRVTKVVDGQDPNGNTHRITFAFDTKVLKDRNDTAYMGPTNDDVKRGSSFAFAHRAHEMGWFLDQEWLQKWLSETFEEHAKPRLKKDAEDIRDEMAKLHHQAHYLNLLHLIGSQLSLPEIKVVSNVRHDLYEPIQVDMVLDVGNSRTCGVLIEEIKQDVNNGLRYRYELELRDLSRPEQVYKEPFESRIEFAKASFGKDHFSVQSGRSDAFLWPTIARVGHEAARMAGQRRGSEGATGLSSPKRYLWDDERATHVWRFNTSSHKTNIEPHATAAPVHHLVNDLGEALHTIDDPFDRMPVFNPHYSRSSLMTFTLSEVLAQALAQINSPAQRLRQSHARVPRHLRSIVLTVPPAMPQPERKIFAERMRQAIGLIWKSLGWYPEDAELDIDQDPSPAFPPFPKVHVKWDEATCGQVVYLFSETINNFGGRPEEFFAALARPDQPKRNAAADPYVSIATIDIGGGTTDLVINEYFLDKGENNIGRDVADGAFYIVPEQRFRDGIKIAGDDIVLDVIRELIVPEFKAAFKNAGVPDPDALVSRLMGSESLDAQAGVLRQQFTLQVLYPVALRILKEYEDYVPLASSNCSQVLISDLLLSDIPPTVGVLNYLDNAVKQEGGVTAIGFNVLDIKIPLNLQVLHKLFLDSKMDICKVLTSLCEVVYSYQPDVLLLTGRPSRLPGILAFVRSLFALPEGRVLPLHGYQTGAWYPFHKNGRIDDPKSTAAVGAMLCMLAMEGRLYNFPFRSAAFKPYSTLRFLGNLDSNDLIKDAAVYYRDIDLDADDYELPDTSFEVRVNTRLGFRQLETERWPASPLYTLSIDNEELRRRLAATGEVVRVSLRVKKNKSKRSGSNVESFDFDIANADGGGGSKSKLKFKLNTMRDNGLGVSDYWLDSGSVR